LPKAAKEMVACKARKVEKGGGGGGGTVQIII
jgi:hypothetical protein